MSWFESLWVRLEPHAAPRKAFAFPASNQRRALAVMLGTLLVASCGFHLRGEADYPFSTIFVNAPSSLPISSELTRALNAASKAKVVASPVDADVSLDIPSVIDDKEVLSLSSGGSVREYQLIKRVAFRLHDKSGLDWMPSGEIVVRRSYTFNETQVLARDLQEQRLLREMQTDAVQQIIRRLQAAKKPA